MTITVNNPAEVDEMEGTARRLLVRWARTLDPHCVVCGISVTFLDVLAENVSLPRVNGDSRYGYEPYCRCHTWQPGADETLDAEGFPL